MIDEVTPNIVDLIVAARMRLRCCVKCGHFTENVSHMVPPRPQIEDDYLFFTCDRCGYKWRTPTLDNEMQKIFSKSKPPKAGFFHRMKTWISGRNKRTML